MNNNVNEIMSSDDSDDDNYNYLKVLDNLNWNKCNQTKRLWFPNTENNENIQKNNMVKNGSKQLCTKRPAVAVQTKSNRNAFLINDLIASKNCKFDNNSNDLKNKTVAKEVINDNNKRVTENAPEVEIIDEILDIDQELNNKTNKISLNANESSKDSLVVNKSKKMRFSQTNYSLDTVLASKRANHEIATEKAKTTAENKALEKVRNFGKAFSPTVHPKEVPVLPPSNASLPSTSNYKIQKQQPLKPQSNFCHSLEDNMNKEGPYSSESILAIILDWSPQWLRECIASEIPPPLCPFGEGLGLKTSYESHEAYQSAYIPLILYETWAQIYDEYQKIDDNRTRKPLKATISAEYGAKDRFITISFQTTSPKDSIKSNCYPSEGDLLILELNVENNANELKKIMVFGFVTDQVIENLNTNTSILPGLVALPGHLLLKYTVIIYKRPLRLNSRQSIQVRPVYYLKPTIRQIEVISALNNNLLFKDILKPRHFTCQVVVPTNISLSNKNFNESQNKAILGSAEALSRPYPIPKLLLIQGPPGTGKTHTLIGIIKQIFISWDQKDNPRILICAPSNGAVDEIARRLYRERHFMNKTNFKRSLRCVRVGQISQIHPDVRKIALETLIVENVDNEVKNFNNKANNKATEIEKQIMKLDQEIANFRAAGQKSDAEKAEFEMQNLSKELQRIGTNNKIDVNKHRLKMDLMLKADIVLSTLNSCHQSPIEMLYKNFGSNTFNCVIVDEASQCSEPELLMPLTYKMTKMILIGDPMQLSATVISKKANNLGLGRSLFERFFKYFGENNSEQKSPVLMLDEQYRMHPQICEFPSNHFYGGKLKSSQKVTENRNFKIKPYVVFDITDTQENRNNPKNKFNELEANFVMKLVSIIDGIVHQNYNIGIITPYNGQKKIISDKIKELKLTTNVEVNTVDGFQGQERDVIIFSCVRAFDSLNGNSVGFLKSIQRMNVGLTRAKYSMILCISGRTLEIDNNWKALVEDAIKRPNCRYKVPSTVANDKITKMIENINFNN